MLLVPTASFPRFSIRCGRVLDRYTVSQAIFLMHHASGNVYVDNDYPVLPVSPYLS